MSAVPASVRPSPINGLGLFADADVPAGTVVIEYLGERIDRDEAVRRDDPASPDHSVYILALTNELFLDGARGGNASRFANHSCAPNCFVSRPGARAFLVASRPIAAGEEITIDYDLSAYGLEACFGGAEACQGRESPIS